MLSSMPIWRRSSVWVNHVHNLPREVFQVCPFREETSGPTQDTPEVLFLSAGLGTPWDPPGGAGGSGREEGGLGFLAKDPNKQRTTATMTIICTFKAKPVNSLMDWCLEE